MKKKNKKIIILPIIIVIIMLVIMGVKHLQYRGTNEFKLKEIGYSNEEVISILDNLEENKVSYILQIEYNNNITKIIDDEYFIPENLERYLALINKEADKSIRDIVAMVNVNADRPFYTDIKDSIIDSDTPYLTLVNKYYKLPEDYKPEEINQISVMYAYDNVFIDSSIYDKFIKMWRAANKEGHVLIANSGYRPYSEQKGLYNDYALWYGQEEADLISAKPGHSEHQLGYVIDLSSMGYTLNEDFEKSDAFKWLESNAHLYGFIIRYPKGKTYLTGYGYEPWHYRYVGEEIAKDIYEKNITYDEYYAYYINR